MKVNFMKVKQQSMADKQQSIKRAAHNLNNSSLCTPTKPVKSKISKPNTPIREMEGKGDGKNVEMSEIHGMFSIMMKKLEKLDLIESRLKHMETEMKNFKDSLEYAYAEIEDLKKDNKVTKANHDKEREKIENLERDNITLRNKIIDLQARSMRDNLLFFNLPENEKENTTETIHEILEKHYEIPNAKNTVKIDRSHRIGRKKEGERKPRPIVVKFNYHQDREYVRVNAKKLKGTRIGVSEQFPEEIESVRKTLYPELKKAKAEGKKARIVRDKLIVEGRVFNVNRS